MFSKKTQGLKKAWEVGVYCCFMMQRIEQCAYNSIQGGGDGGLLKSQKVGLDQPNWLF